MTGFNAFKAQYKEVSQLVPEWTRFFPEEPVNNLGQVLQSGDQAQVMAAMEKLGKVCYDCHLANMAKVQQSFHWIDVNTIKVMDPLTKENLPFNQFKQFMDASFVGIGHNLRQGQLKNTKAQLQIFKSRFAALEDTCGECHGTDERKYYVDATIKDMIGQLEKAVDSPSPNPADIEKLMMGIGTESCFKCHLVHVPAAMAKARWGR